MNFLKGILVTLGIGFGSNQNKVDVSNPIRNDSLVAKINQFNRSDESKSELYKEIKKSNIMLAILADSLKTSPIKKGNATIEPGSKLIPINYELPSGQKVAAVFTDWDEIKKYTSQVVSTIVLKGWRS